jgi:hypothetical protein
LTKFFTKLVFKKKNPQKLVKIAPNSENCIGHLRADLPVRKTMAGWSPWRRARPARAWVTAPAGPWARTTSSRPPAAPGGRWSGAHSPSEREWNAIRVRCYDFIYIFAKNGEKNLAISTQIIAIYAEERIVTLFFKKIAIFFGGGNII